MATHNAIAQVGQAVLGLLADACPRSEFAGAQFELYHAKNFQAPMDLGVSLYLYRLTIAADIRNMQPRTDRTGRRFRPSLPIDLHYLLIPWANNAVMQQRLLGWAIRQIEDTPILTVRSLESTRSGTRYFRAHRVRHDGPGVRGDFRPRRDLGSFQAQHAAGRDLYRTRLAHRLRP